VAGDDLTPSSTTFSGREHVPGVHVEHKSFHRPDSTRLFQRGRVDLVTIAGGTMGLLTLEPGWRWSLHVKPLVKTTWCWAPHILYQVSGRMGVRTADGHEFETRPGDVTSLPVGHDSWVVGDAPLVLVDWLGAVRYGMPRA
jgi:quercetin dioxygenase-like cupin family protein